MTAKALQVAVTAKILDPFKDLLNTVSSVDEILIMSNALSAAMALFICRTTLEAGGNLHDNATAISCRIVDDAISMASIVMHTTVPRNKTHDH